MRSLVQVQHGPAKMFKIISQGGGIAQLVERCLCKADVSGSSPLISILKRFLRLNREELMVETLALRVEEGRGNRRNALVSWKQILIQRFPNAIIFYTID